VRSKLFRLLASAPLCALAACATDSATRAEVDALRTELRLLRESQSRMDQRVERLEVRDTVSRAKVSAATPAAEPAPAPSAPTPRAPAVTTPTLAVVKLKPKGEPAPSLSTRVPVVEPEPEDMEAFVSSAPEEDDAPAPRTSAPREEPEAKDPALAEAEFDQALSALRTGNVEGGVARLQRFADENPKHPRADNALYFSGLGMMGQKEHAAAARLFVRLIETYPAGDAVTDGMLRLAECRQRLNQPDDARALYTRLVTQFPGTAAATQAEQRLATLSP
jgi:tol-pal system protein YbgF